MVNELPLVPDLGAARRNDRRRDDRHRRVDGTGTPPLKDSHRSRGNRGASPLPSAEISGNRLQHRERRRSPRSRCAACAARGGRRASRPRSRRAAPLPPARLPDRPAAQSTLHPAPRPRARPAPRARAGAARRRAAGPRGTASSVRGSATAGTRARPHCSQAAMAMPCQCARLRARVAASRRTTPRAVATGTIARDAELGRLLHDEIHAFGARDALHQGDARAAIRRGRRRSSMTSASAVPRPKSCDPRRVIRAVAVEERHARRRPRAAARGAGAAWPRRERDARAGREGRVHVHADQAHARIHGAARNAREPVDLRRRRDVGRHQVDDIADRAEQGACGERDVHRRAVRARSRQS